MGASSSKSFTDRETITKEKDTLDEIYKSLQKDLQTFVTESGYAVLKGDNENNPFLENVVENRADVCRNFGLFEDKFSKWKDEDLRLFGQKLGLKVTNEDLINSQGTCTALFLYVKDRAEFNLKVLKEIYSKEKGFCLVSSLESDGAYDEIYRKYQSLKQQTKSNQAAQIESGKTGEVGPLDTTSITNLDTAFSQLASKRKSYINLLKNIDEKFKSPKYITNRELQKLKAEFESKNKDFDEFCSTFYKYLKDGGLIDRDPTDLTTQVSNYPVFRQKV